MASNDRHEAGVQVLPHASDLAPSMSEGGLVSKALEKGPEDVDTCRICRGEGTTEEPLFYPCKCSGSIKFVHQECLMEWLSHSQKKHCELCKTSFRFTKLYHPQMPQRLPNSVFARRAALHLLKAFVNWFRGILVVAVWGLWLPWSMRFVWWGLFWLGDGGWTRNFETLSKSWDHEDALAAVSRSFKANATTRPSSSSEISLAFLSPLKMVLALFGLTNSTVLQASPETLVSNITTNLTSPMPYLDNSSLLSNVSFFRDLTTSPGINKFVLDTAEGQIITLSVVTGFVLVFLIREWVVQQQPAINLAAEENEARRPDLGAGDNRAPPNADAEQDNSHNLANPRDAVTDEEDDSGSPLDLTTETISALIDDLRHNQPALQYLAREDYSEWQGEAVDLNLAKDVVLRTKRAYFALKRQSKVSLDSGDDVLARSTLGRLDHLQQALKYLPWKDEDELNDIISTMEEYIKLAYELLAVRDGTPSGRNDGEASLQSDLGSILTQRPPLPEDFSLETFNEPLLEASQLEHVATVPEHWDSPESPHFAEQTVRRGVSDSPYIDTRASAPHTASEASRDRPPMPNRSHFSRATEIRRSLEEADTLEDSRDVAVIPSIRPPSEALLLEPEAATTESSYPSQASEPTPSLFGTGESPAPSAYAADNDARSPESLRQAGAVALEVHGNIDPREELIGRENDRGHDEEVALALPDTRTLLERLVDLIFGDFVPAAPDQVQEGNDEHVVHDLAAEAPFVPFDDAQRDDQNEQEDEAEPRNHAVAGDDALADVAAEAVDNADEAEAMEDAEDLEGILELVGLQGPLIGLFQNAVFAAVLVSATVATAILFPYLCGKVVLLVVANPIGSINLPLKLVSGVTNFAIDFCLVAGGTLFWCLDWPFGLILGPLNAVAPAWAQALEGRTLAKLCRKVAGAAAVRIVEGAVSSGHATGQLSFHLDSHLALRTLEAHVKQYVGAFDTAITRTWDYVVLLPQLSLAGLRGEVLRCAVGLAVCVYEDIKQTWLLALRVMDSVRSGTTTMTIAGSGLAIRGEGSVDDWTINDRVIAILSGYAFFAIAGALYISRGSPITSSDQGRRIENIIREIFQQSAGVVKVILIISLEMLVFPLYCGYLVDAAMLPLFEGSTIGTRFDFTMSSPWTSVFFHWFIGTLFMWNFALFVAMCRRIFRKGVLYFIRDPDDPNFHPIRDVLEKSLSSQLRKIAFSALVYGLLIGFCIGSVVWTVAYCTSSIFPVRWTAKESYFGYPVDLLLYNFLAPLALHFLRPSKGLSKIYEWWFRKAARALRLSHFLFDDFQDDERGAEMTAESQYGTFVRAPGTDSVRIPRGRTAFVEVDEANIRRDRQPDGQGIDEVHGRLNEDFAHLWIPPWFQVRIGLFVVLMWTMTVAIGLSATVLPLLFGRRIIAVVFSGRAPLNDLYSYFIGVLPLLAAYYCHTAAMRAWTYTTRNITFDSGSVAAAANVVKHASIRILRIIYTYGALVVFVPMLLALLLECYFILPLQTYTTSQDPAPHTIYLLQDWTLGLMYLRILLRLLLWDPESRPARGLRAIVAHGWSNPDARLATRCFLVPLTAATAMALCVPAGAAYALGHALTALARYGGMSERYLPLGPREIDNLRVTMIRFSFPLVLAVATLVWSVWLLRQAAGHWRMRIRDEIYLVGERLHNFGDRKTGMLRTARS